ncbi:MAG TPA: DNA translocase FtsK [Ktedonobacteraceae bacterium]|nr:DNA translocase FtsK [Ktedonobacteraceae bacterium]
MARSKEQSGKQRERLVPNITQASSRVSNVVGGESLHSQGKRVEQRTSASSTKAKARAATRGSTGRNGSAKKNPGPTRATPSPTPPAGGPADSRFIARGLNGWNNLEPHHQQRILSVVLLALALLLFASLTIFRHAALLSAISGAFTMLFGWLVYPLAIGLVAFAVAHLVEGMRKQRLIRWPLVIGLIVLSLILMAESDLIAPKAEVGGVIGAILAFPLLGWGFFGHLILIVLFIVIAMVTFRVTLSHVTAFGRAVGGVVVSNRGAAGNGPRPSPFLGQRPVHSRFAQSRAAASEDDDDVGNIDFEADFGDAEDDPENDINLHKGKVSSIPRRQRNAPPLDADEHQDAVQGAVQPELPINQRERRQKKYPTMQELPMRANAPAAAPPASALPSNWPLPELTMLNNPEEVKAHLLGDDTPGLAKLIQETLRSFRVEAEVREADISIGPTVIRFGIRPTGKPTMVQDEKGRYVPAKDPNGNILYEQRTRVNRIMALQNDLALVLEAKTIRMEAPVPGRPYVGVEIPNKNSRLVTLREVLESKEYQSAKAKSKLATALGRDVAGTVRVGDLSRMPHLLIAGATGAGKSVMLNAIIASILTQATPDDVRLLMVDPKMVELNMYTGIPHLLVPVVTEVEKVVPLLKNAINEMERRYRLFSRLGVRNLDGYRKLRAEKLTHGDVSLENLPAIVIIIDELADLMMAAPEEVEGMICRLAQLARATGIHLVIATQRPSVDVITGLIKANIPTRISFMVSSAVDSRTIIDMGGAERLLGRGDMLYLPADAGRPERIQGAFLADDEAERLVEFWKQQKLRQGQSQGMIAAAPAAPEQFVEPGWEIRQSDSDDFELDDDLLEKAEEIVREYGRASISLLQRRLRIGYSRAARLIDLLEEQGIIGPFEPGGRAREILSDGSDSLGGGRTMADEVADIIAEEKAREEFLKKQRQDSPDAP